MRIFFTAAFVLLLHVVYAQTTINRDPEIGSMVKEVNADSLQSYIKAMVAFKTRSTVSSTTDSKAGIGAARNWVLAKFNQFAAASGGRLDSRGMHPCQSGEEPPKRIVHLPSTDI